MKTSSIFILIFLFFVPFTYSQSHSSLTNNSTNKRIFGVDILGNDIWMSTSEGLVKYNKITGKINYFNTANTNLPDDYLLDLFCDNNDNVWVSGKYFGIGKFTDEQFTIYNQENSGLPSDQNNYQIKLDKNGNVWIVSYCWMVKFDGVNWKKWKTGNLASSWSVISGFDIDENNVVWIYSTDGIGKIENDEYTIISDIGSGLIAKAGDVKVDNEQNVWIAIENQGLYKFNGIEFIKYSDSISCLTSTNTIYKISIDTSNTIWFATVEGLIKFNDSECAVFIVQHPKYY